MAHLNRGMFDAETSVTIARDRRAIALLPSFLAAEIAFGAIVVALIEGAWQAPKQLGLWVHGAALLLGGGVVLTALALAAMRRSEPRLGRLRIEEDGLDIGLAGRHRHFALERHRRGWLRPRLDGGMDATLCTTSGHRVTAHFDDPSQAHALLAAAGVSRPHRCLQWPLVDAADWSPTLRLRWRMDRAHLPLPVVVSLATALVVALHVVTEPALLLMSGGFLAAIMLAAASSLATVMARLRRPPTVRVGTDGIAVEGLGVRRFVALGELTRVEATEDGVAVHQRGDARPLVLPIARHDRGRLLAAHDRRELADPDEQAAMRHALMDRIREVLGEWQDRGPGILLPDVDQPAALVEALGRRLRGSYRGASTSSTALVELLLSARGTSRQRLAIAQALAQAPESGVADLRVALDSCADPELAGALEQLVTTTTHGQTPHLSTR